MNPDKIELGIDTHPPNSEPKPSLKEEWEVYRGFFHNNHLVMLLIDPGTGEIVEANQAARAFYGHDFNRTSRLKITDLNALNPAEALQGLKSAQARGRNHFFSRHCLAGGEFRDVEVFCGPLLTHGKELLYSIVREIDEENRPETRKVPARCEAAKEQAHETIDRITLQTVRALASIIEMRDPYTHHHQERVAQLAVAIAREMDLAGEQVQLIYLAAIVHDIGKFRIPSEILCRPGKISDIEYRLIQTHSNSGFEILNKIKFPGPVAKIVLQHHERLNGTGYPHGIRGEEILLEARILGVADVVEALASHRPYRPSLGIGKAMEEISQNREILYDGRVVDACATVFREKRFRFEDYPPPPLDLHQEAD